MSQDTTRRSFVRTTAPLIAAGLAGCLGFGDSSGDGSRDGSEPADGANSSVPPNASDQPAGNGSSPTADQQSTEEPSHDEDAEEPGEESEEASGDGSCSDATPRWHSDRADAANTSALPCGNAPTTMTRRWRKGSPRQRASIGGHPVTDGSSIYVGGEGGWVRSYDLGSGEVEWDTPLDSGVIATIAIGDSRVFVPCDDGVYALDAGSGAVDWSYTRDEVFKAGSASMNYRTPTAPTVQGDVVLVANDSTDLLALDRTSGGVRWRYSAERERGGYDTAPAVADGEAYLATGAQTVNAVTLSSGMLTTDGVEVGAEISTPLTLHDGTLYLGTTGGTVAAYAIDSGGSASRSWSHDADGEIVKSLAVTDDRVFLLARLGDRRRQLVGLDRSSGEVQWQKLLEGITFSPPSVVGDVVYVVRNQRVMGYGTERGERVTRHKTELVDPRQPAFANGALVLADRSATVSVHEPVERD